MASGCACVLPDPHRPQQERLKALKRYFISVLRIVMANEQYHGSRLSSSTVKKNYKNTPGTALFFLFSHSVCSIFNSRLLNKRPTTNLINHNNNDRPNVCPVLVRNVGGLDRECML